MREVDDHVVRGVTAQFGHDPLSSGSRRVASQAGVEGSVSARSYTCSYGWIVGMSFGADG